MNQILADRKISREAQDRQQKEDEFKANESLANYRAANGLPPLSGTTSSQVPASSQNLQGKKYFPDGSFINFDKNGVPFQTGDADGNLSFYTSDKKPSVNSQATAALTQIDEPPPIVAASSVATPPVTTGGLTQANQNIKYFDDGSYIQTFDDGTSTTFDSDGNPFRSTDTEGNSELATTSTYDDAGNQTISDYYGNVVQVLDPQGNVIPFGWWSG